MAEVKIEGDKLDEAVHRAMAEYVGVDRDALLALADKLEHDGLAGWASGPVNVGEYARRIREACGEVDG